MIVAALSPPARPALAASRRRLGLCRPAAAAIAAGLLFSTGALACTPVTAVPATLGHGVYCLTADVEARGETPITLEDDATLDCRGHAIRDASRSTWNGLVSSADNIAVKNCTFDGFFHGIEFVGATHYRIVDNTFLAPMYSGIYADGDDGLISGNVFSYPKFPMPGHPASWDEAPSTAIIVQGTVDVVHNTISAAASDGTDWTDRTGIDFRAEGLVAYNVVRGLVPGQGHVRAGIEAHGRSLLYRNTLAVPHIVAWEGSDFGLNCDQAASVENVIVGFTSRGLGCDDHAERGLAPRNAAARGAASHSGR